MHEDALAQMFERRLADVCSACGPLMIFLIEGSIAHFPKPRSFAFFAVDGPAFAPVPDVPIIAFAPKFRTATVDRVEAILLHEFGHAMDFLAKKTPLLPADRNHDPAVHRQGTERRADALAEGLWGIKIGYDKDTVQSLCCGIRPRPVHLGL